MSGYSVGYMLAKGEPVFLQCEGNAMNYSKGFEAGYADGSWEYRDYNLNMSAKMKGADEGFFSGYVNGYVLGHMEKDRAAKVKPGDELASLKEVNKGLEDKILALEAGLDKLENEVGALKSRGLESELSSLEAELRQLRQNISALEGKMAGLESKVKALEAKPGG
jgi:predicted  nucleic acid-binding Zn-ribbon protein